jgi:glutamyl-tRNA reductase
MHRLVMVGLNHTTTPLAIREKLAFSGSQRRCALEAFRQRFPHAEAVLLSTCNRVELYAARPTHGHPRVEELWEFLAAFHSIPPGEVAHHFYRKTRRDVIAHAFAVAASLDSLVLGETQILGQVRQAYDLARETGTAGPLLNPLFQRAVAVGKQVMNDTPLGEGRLSVASAAVDYARRIFDHFADKTVLSIGAGKMATLVLKGFSALKPGRLLVCNRDAAKAGTLAQRFGGQPVPFESLEEQLVQADVVISSTGAAHPIITRRQFDQLVKQRRYRPAFLIDIALPRDIEESVGQIENVYLYNIDDLQQVVAATMSQRVAAVEAARLIVDRQVEEFIAWHRTREMGPLIDRMYKRYQEIAMDEVARTVNKLGDISEHEREHLEELARRMVNKFLHDPVRTLRNSNGQSVPSASTVEQLFGLAMEAERRQAEAEGEAQSGDIETDESRPA